MWQIFKLLLRNFSDLYKSRQLYKIIVFFSSSVLLGLLAGYLLNTANDGLLVKGSDESIVYLLAGLFMLPFIRIVLPAYKPLRRIVLHYHPVSSFNKMIINLFIDMLSGFFIFLFIFLLTITIISKDFNLKLLIQGYLLIITSHLFRRIFQNIIENRYDLRSSVTMALLIILVFSISFFKRPYMPSNFDWALMISGLSVFLLFFIESKTPGQNRSFLHLKKSTVKNIFWQFLFYNRAVRLSLIIGLTLKIVFFITDMFFVRHTGRHILDGNLLYWILIAAPTIHFSYVFNNLWGHYRILWLQLRIHSGNDWKEYLNIFYKLISIPLVIDMVISLVFLLILWNDKLFVISFYLVSLFFLSCFSFYWSFVSPAYATDSAVFKIAHSPKGNFICLLGTGLLYLMKIDSWFYMLIPFYIFLSVLFILKIKSDLEKNERNIFPTLFSA
ncbi:MAG TPA: hypothetical protein PLM01_04080 [Bacteroidales bacterium]|jgi:hypothetical protein|nr:hypothetical protein [Bacteroidales bacterium]